MSAVISLAVEQSVAFGGGAFSGPGVGRQHQRRLDAARGFARDQPVGGEQDDAIVRQRAFAVEAGELALAAASLPSNSALAPPPSAACRPSASIRVSGKGRRRHTVAALRPPLPRSRANWASVVTRVSPESAGWAIASNGRRALTGRATRRALASAPTEGTVASRSSSARKRERR